MTEVAALALTYGVVWIILLLYLTRLRRRVQQLERDRHPLRSNAAPRAETR